MSNVVAWVIFCGCIVIGVLVGLFGTLMGMFGSSWGGGLVFAVYLIGGWTIGALIGLFGWAMKRVLTRTGRD